MTTAATATGHPRVAVLDPDGPPGVAFIRSLGARGVHVDAYGGSGFVAGRWSRFVGSWNRRPDLTTGDPAIEWLAGEIEADRIDLVAPTSDTAVFVTAAAYDRLGRTPPPGVADLDAAWACLHKGVFADVAEAIGFPTVPQSLPTSIDAAISAAGRLGYPLVLKPRTHVGVGLHRGAIVHNETELRSTFKRFDIDPANARALALDPDLGWPLVQRFLGGDDLDVVSVSGCLTSDGTPEAVGYSRKLAQWPPGLGIGSLFEAVTASPATEPALRLAERALHAGVFELEVCIDRSTGDAWPIDLNPRAYGQVSLALARGDDLAGQWYELATGHRLPALEARSPLPEIWMAGMSWYPGALVQPILGPNRREALAQFRRLRRRPRVGSIFRRDDPVPAIVLAITMLRHPGGLVRPFLKRSGETR